MTGVTDGVTGVAVASGAGQGKGLVSSVVGLAIDSSRLTVKPAAALVALAIKLISDARVSPIGANATIESTTTTNRILVLRMRSTSPSVILLVSARRLGEYRA